jgi:hypothetical protein
MFFIYFTIDFAVNCKTRVNFSYNGYIQCPEDKQRKWFSYFFIIAYKCYRA